MRNREAGTLGDRAIGKTVRGMPLGWLHPALWFLGAMAVAAFLIMAAYQVRPTYRIDIGYTPQDTVLVRDFNAPERQPPADGGQRFRWTRGESALALPGIGRGARSVDLVLSGGGNPNPDLRLLANGLEIATLHLAPDFRPYHAEIPASAMTHGSLTLSFVGTPYTPRGDRRQLGVVVQEVTIHPVGVGLVLPPARIAISLWIGAVFAALALLIAGFGGVAALFAALVAAGGMAAFLIGNRLFLTVDTGGIVRAGVLMITAAAAVRILLPALCGRLGMPTRVRDVRWLALIAAATLAVRFAGVLHPDIFIVDLKFHLHRLADVADRHTLLLPIQSAEFGGRTVLYAPTPYVVMLPFSWLIRDRTLLLFLFSLAIDGLRFCILWYVARRVTRDLLAANLAALTMALMPVGWIVYSWGTFANIFAEGMLTFLFALLILDYGRLSGPRRWWWCGAFALVIALTLLAHIGVFVLTAGVSVLYLLGRVALMFLPPGSRSRGGKGEKWRGVMLFGVAGLIAAVIAFALFYRYPAHDILAGTNQQAVEQEATSTQNAPAPRQYRMGGATPDDRIGLPAITTPHLSVALVREAWEMSWAFYRLWPVLVALVGVIALTPAATRMRLTASSRDDGETSVAVPDASRIAAESAEASGDGTPQRDAALTMIVWFVVAAIMLVVGLIARLYVRYPLFALPAVALGSGVALAWLVRRWRWGWIVAALLLVVSAVTTLLMWYDRIVYAFKVIV